MLVAGKAKASGGKRGGAKDPDEAPRSDKRRRDMDDSDPELELDSDFKQIVTMLRHIKDKAHKDGQKKTAISRATNPSASFTSPLPRSWAPTRRRTATSLARWPVFQIDVDSGVVLKKRDDAQHRGKIE
uniref:Uncharacterized protein n=1 Tax=Aegilops tauschii TaxID=37682 RepID=M8BR30_AEGTA